MTKAQLRYGLRRARLVFESDSLIFFVAYLVIVSGIPIMIDPSIFAPVSVQSALSEWLIRLWGADLLVGGLLSGYGLLGERPRIEQAGLALLAAGSLIFAFVVVVYSGFAGLLPCLTYALYTAAATARFRKLNRVADGIKFARRLQE
jgi:hypothetical protein